MARPRRDGGKVNAAEREPLDDPAGCLGRGAGRPYSPQRERFNLDGEGGAERHVALETAEVLR
jgi:hypothetical protein